jgi:DNA repair exonuclease SbcCD nuclease subunit
VPHGALLPTSSASLREEVQDYYEVMVTHYGVNEARLGPKDFKMKEDLTVKQLKELNYDLILLGHIHKPQVLADNIIVMGSVMAHSFHETDEKKYYYVLDTETREFVKYESEAPKFVTIDIKTKAQLKKLVLIDGNYYRVNILTTKITPKDTAELAGRNVIISYTKASGLYEGGVKVKRKTRTPQDEINEYYDIVDTELDRKLLKKKAIEIVGVM